MENGEKLDARDYEILRELDTNFRQSFSKIGKKVKLSKNSVALRFSKLKEYTLHNATGLNNELIGYKLIKVFYSFDFYNEETEKAVINEVKKHKNIVYGARYYGLYDLCIAFFVDNLDNFIFQINKFDERFAGRINRKDIQILYRQTYFRYNFLHKIPVTRISDIQPTEKRVPLSELDKKIITIMRYNPRINVVDISRKLRVSTKTISNRIKNLEKSGAIMGYFMTINPVKFNYDTFMLLIQLQSMKKSKEFEKYLYTLKNVKYIAHMLGFWDFEIDLIYPNVTELQNQIEIMKQRFPSLFKKIEIISFGKRIVTNKDTFLT